MKILNVPFSLLYLGAGVLAIAWLVGMAAGFPVASLPFWTRWLVAPAIVLAAVVYVGCTSFSGNAPRRDAVKQTLRIAAVCFLAAITVSARYHFPITMHLGLVLLATVFISLLAIALVKQTRGLNLPVLMVVCTVAGSLGFYLPHSQRGLDPATTPNNSPLEIAEGDDPDEQFIKTEHTMVDLPGKAIAIRNDQSKLLVLPMLDFTSCSPDRCWTVFSPRQYFSPAPRLLTQWAQQGATILASYENTEGPVASWSVHHVSNSEIALDARSKVRQETYSHLNGFSYVEFAAQGKLSLSFSPCGPERIDFTVSDYPVGRPARFAYLDSDQVFHVVEASSAEKGPFKEIAAGKLDTSFVIQLHAGDDTLFTIEMADWARQASTQMSPTAGWGVPENAIEFRRVQNRAVIFFTLAGTSVGRGFQSVGHSPGTYQNRMVIKRM